MRLSSERSVQFKMSAMADTLRADFVCNTVRAGMAEIRPDEGCSSLELGLRAGRRMWLEML
ncbi:hypothetical protein IW137_004814 [Coemansia sp. RSA 1287]|nr:hypothetical protein IW137_004814 [Coemansia sp. RSA 1287]